MLDAWGSSSSAWSGESQVWQPSSGDATAAVSSQSLTLTVHSASAVADCSTSVGVVACSFSTASASVVFTKTWTPAANSDDGWRYGSSSFNNTASGYAFGMDGTTAMHIFVRFPSVSIPSGATITDAKWSRTPDYGNTSSPTDITLHFNAADNAAAPTTASGFDALSLTSGVDWDSVASESSGNWYDSPDISSELQAVVDRSGWSSGNAVMLVVKNAVASGTTAYRTSKSYEAGSSYYPKLTVSWTTAAGSVNATANVAAVSASVTPQAATATSSTSVAVSAALPMALAVYGATVGISSSVTVAVATVNLSLAVGQVSVSGAVTVTAGSPALTISVHPASASTASWEIAPVDAVALSLASHSASVSCSVTAAANPLALALSAHAAAASDSVTCEVGALAAVLSVQPGLAASSAVAPCGRVEASLTALPASVTVDSSVVVGAVSAALMVQAAVVSAGMTADVATVVLELAAQEASVIVDAMAATGLLGLTLSAFPAVGRPVSRDDAWVDAAIFVLALTQPPAEYRATHLREWIRLQSAPPAAKSRTSAPGSTGNLGGRVLAAKNLSSGGSSPAQEASPTLEIKPLRSPVDLQEA